MNQPAPLTAQASPAASRSDMLENFLKEDPNNANLLADACEAAIAAGLHDRALAHVRTAEEMGLEAAPWRFRHARICIAQRDLPQAQMLLEELRSTMGEHPAIAHDLAYVRFLGNDFAGARELLSPWIEGEAGAGIDGAQMEALQVLWLRTAHRLKLLHETWDWVVARRAEGALLPAAAGVASLMAIDADHYNDAKALSEIALAQDPGHMEALVARGYVALGQRDNALATQLLQRALQRNAHDGRTWSALGFASIQRHEFPRAQQELEKAVATMPTHIGTWHGLAWSRLLQGNMEGALEAFRHALDLDRNFGESQGAVGMVLAMMGRAEEAEHHLVRAERLDRSNVFGRFGRAILKGEAKSGDEVKKLFVKLLDRPGMFGEKLGEWVERV